MLDDALEEPINLKTEFDNFLSFTRPKRKNRIDKNPQVILTRRKEKCFIRF